MNSTRKTLPTRVFRAGNSQAVRIPKAFELPEGQVLIEQRPGGLFVKPKRGGWEEFFSKVPLEFDLDPVELRATGPDRPVKFNLTSRNVNRPRRGK